MERLRILRRAAAEHPCPDRRVMLACAGGRPRIRVRQRRDTVAGAYHQPGHHERADGGCSGLRNPL